MNMFARFDEIPTMTLQDIRKQKFTDGHAVHLKLQRTNNSNQIGPLPLLFLLKVFALEI